jgi:hypothetical protein
MNYELKKMTKKYILKPGKHQFAPGSHAVHDNDNLTDEDAEWYIEKYPHIAGLFVEKLDNCKVEVAERFEIEIKPTEIDQQQPEN